VTDDTQAFLAALATVRMARSKCRRPHIITTFLNQTRRRDSARAGRTRRFCFFPQAASGNQTGLERDHHGRKTSNYSGPALRGVQWQLWGTGFGECHRRCETQRHTLAVSDAKNPPRQRIEIFKRQRRQSPCRPALFRRPGQCHNLHGSTYAR